MPDHPYELSQYIAVSQDAARYENVCNHRPTYEAELDRIEACCVEKFERGAKLIASIEQGDLERCRKLYAHQQGSTYDIDRLTECRIGGAWVLVPTHVSLIEKVRALKEVMA